MRPHIEPSPQSKDDVWLDLAKSKFNREKPVSGGFSDLSPGNAHSCKMYPKNVCHHSPCLGLKSIALLVSTSGNNLFFKYFRKGSQTVFQQQNINKSSVILNIQIDARTSKLTQCIAVLSF